MTNQALLARSRMIAILENNLASLQTTLLIHGTSGRIDVAAYQRQIAQREQEIARLQKVNQREASNGK